MSRFTRICTSILAAAIGFVGAALVANPASAAPKDVVVNIERTAAESIDIGQPGSSIGDLWVSRGKITAKGSARQIGSYSTLHIVVTPTDDPALEERSVQAEFRLPGGVIQTAVMLDALQGASPGTAEHIIVGGTGKYFGARGTAMITPVSGTGSKIRFRFAD